MEAEGMVWLEHREGDRAEKTGWRLYVENSE